MHPVSSFKMLQCTFGPYTNEDTPEESKLYSKVHTFDGEKDRFPQNNT